MIKERLYPHVQLTVGMVGSGKSTYALNCARAGFVVVNDDSIVESVHSDYGLYDASLKPIYKAVGQTILTHAIALGRPVVIDTGSRNRLTRSRWVSLAKALDVPVFAVVFPFSTPEEHAQRRFDSDSRGYSYDKWLNVIHRHIQEWESVTLSEGFDVVVEADWESISRGWTYK